MNLNSRKTLPVAKENGYDFQARSRAFVEQAILDSQRRSKQLLERSTSSISSAQAEPGLVVSSSFERLAASSLSSSSSAVTEIMMDLEEIMLPS